MRPLFDTHFHILDHRFPLSENQGFAPPVFTADDYRGRTRGLDVRGGSAGLADLDRLARRVHDSAAGMRSWTSILPRWVTNGRRSRACRRLNSETT